MAKTDAQIGIRVTSQFKARLERQAERERRSVSNLVLKVMEEYLEQQEDGESSGS
ncbi:MAG: ribbon-helix-helix domain-containing protein [Lawsonibacter sp.]|jgi:predicted DNA-binding protein